MPVLDVNPLAPVPPPSPADAAPESAFARIVGAHQDRVVALAVHLTRDADLGADLAQEAFIRLWTRGAAFWPTADTPRLRAWLLRTVRNLAIDHHRAALPRRADSSEATLDALCDDAPTPSESAEHADDAACAFDALHTLREPYRSLVMLRDVEGLAYADLVATLGLPLATVKVYLHRGRAMLRAAYLLRTRAHA